MFSKWFGDSNISIQKKRKKNKKGKQNVEDENVIVLLDSVQLIGYQEEGYGPKKYELQDSYIILNKDEKDLSKKNS